MANANFSVPGVILKLQFIHSVDQLDKKDTLGYAKA